jgi:hypothetical protein
MAVTINSGPIEADDQLRHVPRGKWRELMLARRQFLEIKLSYDCRCLVQFVNDAQEMFGELGFETPEALIRDGYGLEPDEVAVAVEWLRLNPPEEPIKYKLAIFFGRRAQDLAADPDVRPAAQHGGDRTEQGADGTLTDGTLKGRGSNAAAYIVRRLKRDHPEIAAALARGEYRSARAAGIAAGIVKKRRCPHCGGDLT